MVQAVYVYSGYSCHSVVLVLVMPCKEGHCCSLGAVALCSEILFKNRLGLYWGNCTHNNQLASKARRDQQDCDKASQRLQVVTALRGQGGVDQENYGNHAFQKLGTTFQGLDGQFPPVSACPFLPML